MMRCRYCGADNPEGEARCVKCQRRMMLGQNGWEQSVYPVVTTAAAPDYNQHPEPFDPAARGRFEMVAANPAVTRRLPPKQKRLFALQDNQRVVEMDASVGAMHAPSADRVRDPLAADHRRPRRARVSSDQEAFDFYANAQTRPAQPFTRELVRGELPMEVAPLALRAMAVVMDLAISAGLSLLFFIAVRLWLGYLPLTHATLMFFAPVPVLIGIAYKLAYALNGSETIGMRSLRLKVVSYDGQRPTIMQRIVRIFMGILSFVAAGFGLLWAVTDEESLTWHDMVTQTFLATVPSSYDEAEA